MPSLVPSRLLSWSLAGLCLPVLLAQAPTPAAPAAPPTPAAVPQDDSGPHHVIRRYPRDRDVPIAVVADVPLTLGDLVDHLDSRHHPGFREALEKRPEIQRMLQSDLVAPWVRHFADLKAIEHLTKDTPPDKEKLEAAQSEQLKLGFQGWLDSYTALRRQQGRPTDFTQDQINRHLTRYQLEKGLACELQGTLDYLEPKDYTRGQLQEFYQNNARALGGTVTTAHILIHHRDPGTGILFDDGGLAKAMAKLADVRARLRPDGSNFEEVAKLCSMDEKTGPNGGMLGNVHRFDDRLPAPLCRAAWELRDGEVSDVVESPYGWHLVKRIDFQQHVLILFTDDAIPTVRDVMHRWRQEEILFQARAAAKVRLLL